MKKVSGFIKLQVPAGKANPSPPIGPALGQHGVNIMEFCKQFNARTQAQAKDDVTIPVEITVYSDRSFTFITKTPPAPILIKKAAGLATQKKPGSGSKEPNKVKVGKISAEAAAGHRHHEDAGPQHHRRRGGDAHHRRHGAIDGYRGGRPLRPPEVREETDHVAARKEVQERRRQGRAG